MESPAATSRTGPKIWAVAGGKGGVGKSFVACNLAVSLARQGQRVVIVDGDLGGANIDTLLGCEPPSVNLGHFFSREVKNLAQLVTPTGIPGLSFVGGDANSLGAANPGHAQKLKLIRHIRGLDADIALVDLGAGTSFNTLDLYLAADMGLAVVTGEPTAVQNCFAFIKAAALRDLERTTGVKRRATDQFSLRRYAAESTAARGALRRTTRLIVNRAGPSEGRRVANLIHGLCGRFLGGPALLMGVVHDDPRVPLSVRRMIPVCSGDPTTPAALDIDALSVQLLTPAVPHTRKRMASGVNEEVIVDSVAVHLQTEDLGTDQGAVRTQAFATDGSVLYSRRTPYVDRFFMQLAVAQADRVRFHHVAVRQALILGRIALTRRAG